jgi:geranylgeranyl diphosphate synthase type II
MTAAQANAVRLVPALLDRYGAQARSLMAAYLTPRSPPRHLYDMVADYPTRGGRSLRASLCIAATRMFGGTLEQALHVAAALELIHNAFLVHDDVEDESEERRGRPTLNALHGVPTAVNVGDALVVLALRPLLDTRATLGQRLALRIVEETDRMARESVEGQAVELGWRRDNTVAVDEAAYLRMVLQKTCWYTTIFPLRLGALIGTRDGVPLDRFVRLGFLMGAAFQIQDDLLNLIGDKQRYGKEINGDIREGKRTLMLIRLLELGTAAERESLRRLLALPRQQRTAGQVRWVRRRMDHYGCIDYARQVAHGLAGAAQHEFSKVCGHLPDSDDKRFVQALAVWVLSRR